MNTSLNITTDSEENTPKIRKSTVFFDFLEQLFDYSKNTS